MSSRQTRKETAKTLGEHKIIQLIQKKLAMMPNATVPFGDDVSAVPLGGDRVAVLKTDMLVAKTDVPVGMSMWQAARKAMVMNVSDFASKGAVPSAAMVALGLPADMPKRDILKIAEGLNSAAQEYGVYVVGGDTSETSDLIISVSLYGTAKKSELMLRSGAKPGDILAVTGFFGNSAAGLQLLLNKSLIAKADLRKNLQEAVFMPQARLKEGLALSQSRAVSASMDSSDGLAWSLHELGCQSNVGFVLDSIPVSPEAKEFAKQNGLSADDLALYGGEEYELVLAVKPEGWKAAVVAVESVGGHLIPIGKATENKEVILTAGGKKQVIQARGWEHFKS